MGGGIKLYNSIFNLFTNHNNSNNNHNYNNTNNNNTINNTINNINNNNDTHVNPNIINENYHENDKNGNDNNKKNKTKLGSLSSFKIFSKLKNSIFLDNNEDETFIFKQLKVNSNFNKNESNNKDNDYWNREYNNKYGNNDNTNSNNINRLRFDSNTTNDNNINDKKIQKGYLNKVIGKRTLSIVNKKLFLPFFLVFIAILTMIVYLLFGIEIAMAIIILFFTTFFGIFYLPKMNKDSSEISKELPYALRQMVTELRSGKGLHDTIASIASSGYGALSHEFSRVIEEIKYGENTEKALINMSNRVSSDGLNRAVQQIVGTLRTGGNLGFTLNIIAEDVSYDLQIKLKEYSQKLNAFIMIYTFLAILGPVIFLIMLMAASTVMGDIIPNNVVLIIYIFFFPMIVVFMGLMIKKLEPSL